MQVRVFFWNILAARFMFLLLHLLQLQSRDLSVVSFTGLWVFCSFGW